MGRAGVWLAALTVVGLWSGAFLAIRGTVETLSVGTLVTLRYGIAALAFGVLALLRGAPARRPHRRDLPRLLLLGLTGAILYNGLLALGQTRLSAGAAAVLVNTIPLWSALFASVGGQERVSRRRWVGLGVAFAGAAVVSLGGGAELSLRLGALAVLAAAACQAVYFLLVAETSRRYGGLDTATWTIWAATLLLCPLLPGAIRELGSVDARSFAALLYLGAVVSTAGTALWAWTLARLPVSTATVLLYLVPPVTALGEWAIYDETPGAGLAVGGALTLAGIAWSRTGEGRPATAVSAAPSLAEPALAGTEMPPGPATLPPPAPPIAGGEPASCSCSG